MSPSQNILVTSAGRRVSLVRALQRSLGERGHVFCADANPGLSAACRVAAQSFSLPRVTEPEYLDALRSVCLDNNIRMVIPTIDTELKILAEARESFSTDGIELLVSDTPLIEICRDKRLLHTFFTDRNIDVPELYSRDTIKFPLFVKPFNGSRSVNAKLIPAKEDFIPPISEDDDLMLLEAIDTSVFAEVTIDLYFNRASELCCIVPRKRLEVRDGEVNKAVTIDSGLVDYVRTNLASLPGARGCLNLQVFFDETTSAVRAIEINPRFGGGYPLTDHSGADFTSWLVKEYFDGGTVQFWDGWQRNVVMLRYDAEIIVHGG